MPDDIANAAVYMLNQPPGVSVKAMDVVPSGKLCRHSRMALNNPDITNAVITAQRSLTVFDRKWNERNSSL